ncbi:MAG: hypothetical protein Q6K80_08795 [Thermostichus sp. DG_1_6_bins_120]
MDLLSQRDYGLKRTAAFLDIKDEIIALLRDRQGIPLSNAADAG